MSESGGVASHRKNAIGYVVLIGASLTVIALSLGAGRDKVAPKDISGRYELAAPSPCLGSEVIISQSGKFVTLGETAEGKLTLSKEGTLSGEVSCADGSTATLDAHVSEPGTEDRSISGTAGDAFEAEFTGPVEEVEAAPEKRSGEETFGRLMLAIAAVMLAARLMGSLVSRIGQPRVMGEVIAGILLGPTLVGALAPGVTEYLFPPDIIPLLTAGADIGLVFYMFLVGLELDPEMLRGRFEQAAFISHGSIAVPMALGVATAVPIFEVVGPDSPFLPFALFMGVSMSITAFPVLARILVERRMLKRPVGAIAIGSAAVDDITAWALLALATGVAATGTVGLELVKIVGLAILFSLFMVVVVRRVLAKVADAYDEAGHVPPGWIAAIFIGVLLSAYLAAAIPIAAIFGAFVMGLVMPRRADLTHDVTRRIEDFVLTVLLPLFFVVTGLRTQIGLIDRPALWLLTLALIGVAVAGKWFGAMGTARFTGLGLRESAAVGALMNTRGLTELIVLNIGLEFGVITPALFTMLVIMALVTTFMTGPALRLIDPKGSFSAPPEEELRDARRVTGEIPEAQVPERSILVAPLDEKNLDALLALAEPLGRSTPPRELILSRLLVPVRNATGVASDERELEAATDELTRRQRELVDRGVATRAVAFTSADPGEDLVRLASEQEVDLVLADGRRPLLGEGVPGGEVGALLERAPCDVAILVEREGAIEVGEGRPVMVPFGGAEHDWAALELAAWVAAVGEAPLTLLGTAADVAEGERDASRLLANASLVVQQLAGVVSTPLLVRPGKDELLEASAGAGLLVVGLSERWRQEGLGPVRSEIARSATAPVLFVRRGQRPGALAPREDHTRFSWSRVGPSR